jgi:type IV secretory pathway VirB10-like protein
MFSNRLTFGVVAIACVVAAGAGGYFASRQNAVPTPVAAEAASTPATPAPAAATPERPVQETEAVVAETAPKAVVTAGGSSRRAEPARNTPTPPARSSTATARQSTPALERSWPTSTPSQSSTSTSSLPSTPAATVDSSAAAAPVEDRAPLESPRAPEPPQKIFNELVVSANSVIGLETENRISSETARIEDRVEAKVTRDVKVGDTIAVPAGSRAIGSVIQIERGGKFKERARLGIRFTTLVLADGTRLSMSTETIYREGEAPGNSSAAKIGGGAIGGAIIGGILGGAKGAAIGATAGAGGGVAAVQVGDRQEVTLPAGSPMTVRLLAPVTVTVEQQ